MISSVYTKSHTWLPSHPNSKMLQILNFVTYIWVSELDLASMQGFRSFPSIVAHFLVKAWLCFPNLLPPPLHSLVPLWATCHRVSVGPGLPIWVTQSLFPGLSEGMFLHWFPQAAICPALQGLEEDAVNIRYLAPGTSFFHRSPCQPFPTPLWRTVSFPARAFSLRFYRKCFSQSLHKAPGERNWPFIHNWPQCGLGGSESRSKCAPELT